MAIASFELTQVASEYVTADLIVWKKYMNRAPGMLELMLDANPQLAMVHRVTPFIPVFVYIRVPIDPDLMIGKMPIKPQDSIWVDRAGYTL